MSAAAPLVLSNADVEQLLDPASVLESVREIMLRLGRGAAVQPPQTVVDLTGGADVVSFHGLDLQAGLYGVKVSPYLPQPHGKPVVTAWTLLLSTETGAPVALIDAAGLTAHRTAATSALALDRLAAPGLDTLSVVGTGPLARAHVSYATQVRPITEVRVIARDINDAQRAAASWAADVGDAVALTASDDLDGATGTSPALMLCTSAAAPLVDLARRPAESVTTSISTNATRAHEVEPSSLAAADVFVDHMPSALTVAWEFTRARELGIWEDSMLAADLPGLLARANPPATRRRPAYFRSVGLGLEDVAIGHAVLGRV